MGGNRAVDVHTWLPNTASIPVRKVDPRTALALIDVAHPNFREELLAAAKRLGYVLPSSTWPRRPHIRA